jgi:HD-like signal output (HDOD) protein
MQQHEKLYQDIITAIEQNQLRLPTQPEVAVRIRETAEDPNVTGKSLADVISKDPALTARIMGIANSPLMRGVTQVDTLSSAINRMGVGFVANLATGLAMEQIFHATDERIHNLMDKVWKHSAEVAAYSMVISKHFAKLPQDQATLAGLLHKVGILPILAYAEMNEDILEDEEEFASMIEKIYPKLGKAILETWKFPSEFCELSLTHAQIKRPEHGPADYSDIIQVADIMLKDPFLPSLAKCSKSATTAFELLGLKADFVLSDDELLSVELEEANKLFRTN